MAKALILTDGKAGHENQSKALARALGLEYEIAAVRFKSRFHKALSYLFDKIGVNARWLWEFFPDARDVSDLKNGGLKPAVVIGTGSGTFYPAKSLARTLGVKCAVVLYPRGYRLKSFDCIMAPSFDNPEDLSNVIRIPANLVSNDAEFYEDGVKAFSERHSKSDKTALAVIIGGPNKCSTMSADWMKAQLDEIFAKAGDCEKWVTTSRRTPSDVESLVESYPWDYKLIYSKDHFNPIPAFVALASRLYVTAESTGMISEAATCGCAEVYALDNLNPGPHKFRRFVETLRENGYVDGARKVDLSSEFARAKELLGL
ncbi:MAG: mitochondrial fission ELM1 family protein [Kiritimatiellae bacterium]|nr:mitochondrial fission ELM1 family protein [Kiritimatiellia bacterium]